MRYERKFRVENIPPQELLQYLKQHPAGLISLYPDRQINNIYFDTPNFVMYQDNVMGLAERKKVRVRWYGENIREIRKPILELKTRHNEQGDKKSFPVQIFSLAQLAPLTQEVAQLSQIYTALQPVLLNSYKRSYWGTRNGEFRWTLDWDLRYTSLVHNPIFQTHQHSETGVCILELKYAPEHEERVDEQVQFIPFPRTKNSKYVSGVELTL